MMYKEDDFICSVIKILNDDKISSQKIHLQKFISYLSDVDDDVPFSFSIYTYGPYCSDLSFALDSLVTWGDIKYENNSYMAKTDKFLPKDKSNKIQEKLNKLISILPDTCFSTMELYGTLHYYMYRTKPIDIDVVIKKFKDAKGDKFDNAAIENAFIRLNTLFS